jgi:hypothetical protein
MMRAAAERRALPADILSRIDYAFVNGGPDSLT